MIHDRALVAASRDAFGPAADPIIEAEAYAAAVDDAQRFADQVAVVAIILVLIAFAVPLIVRGLL